MAWAPSPAAWAVIGSLGLALLNFMDARMIAYEKRQLVELYEVKAASADTCWTLIEEGE